jgi:hypothetical protein
MSALARTSSNCERQTHPFVREDVTDGLTESVRLETKITGRESQGACRQDKPTVVK